MAKPPTRRTTSVVTARTRNKTLRRVQRHVLLAAAYERGLASDIEKVLRRIVRSAAKHVADGAPEQATKVVASYQAGLTRIFEGRLEAVAMASAKLVFEELSAEKGGAAGFETKFISLFEIAQAAVRSWLVSYAAAKVTQILENTRTQIRKAIVRGNDQNEPPRVLARRIKDETGGLIAKRRAETIARTETHTAANVGSDAAADATGLTLEKEWCSTEDQRVRPTHHEANGQRVDKEMDFIVGGERLRFPGDPRASAGNIINCRCIVLWHPRIPKPPATLTVEPIKKEIALPIFGKDKAKNIETAVKFIESIGIEAVTYSRASSKAAAMASGGKIHFNKSHGFWKDPEGVAKYNYEIGQLSTDKAGAMLYHEIGHLIYDSPDNFSVYEHRETARKHVSKYAGTNPHEFVSEVYAAKKTGRQFPEIIEKMFQYYAKQRILTENYQWLFEFKGYQRAMFSQAEFNDEGMIILPPAMEA